MTEYLKQYGIETIEDLMRAIAEMQKINLALFVEVKK